MFKQDSKNIKFSHKLFSQYFISAIIPVVVLSLISFYTVSKLLEKNATRQVYTESRAIGLTIYDRLQTLDRNLLELTESVDSTAQLKTSEWLKTMYSSLYITDADVIKEVVHGEDVFVFELSYAQKEYLHTNKNLLIAHKTDVGQGKLLLLRTFGSADEHLLVAVLNPKYLWKISVKETDRFCITFEQNLLLHCSNNKSNSINSSQLKDTLITLKKSGLQESMFDDEVYLTNSWDLFLEANFGITSLSIVYLMQKNEALLEYNYYLDVFPLLIIITLLVVFILSSIQMRRALKPLMKLTQGAKNLIAGDFTRTVDIDSKDEFEALAGTFNDMSQRINEQFKRIKTLAKIDRLILSTPNKDYIIEVLLEYIPTVISVDSIAIFVMSTETIKTGVLFYGENSLPENICKTSISLSEFEFLEINNTENILKKAKSDCATYIEPLTRFNGEFFLVSPLKNKAEVIGLICIGLVNEAEAPVEQSLIEISDRAAVALSNANWEKKLFHQAHYDALTKLPNRYLFKDRLEQAIERARRQNLNVAVLFIDLDRFKSVNDSLGHMVGDQLLVEVSNILLKCVRSSDSIARFGGDEFTIVVPDIANNEVSEQLESLSNRIIELMSLPIYINDREFYISPSIGIAVYPLDGNSFDELLRNADTAMYEAKNFSAGNYQFYQEKQNKETLARLELENDLRHALDKEQLELYYQPKINLRNCTIYDVEALSRWKHPERGFISPALFIPLAEETGLIAHIGYWVMRCACIQTKMWNDKGIQLNVAVNVSADQFRQPDFYNKMIAIIEEIGADPKSIELEITESITIEDFTKTINLLNKFRTYGFKLCIDDFGTGYSSMTYLQKIPINKMKIDKSFIDNIHLDNDSASITKAIVALAHNLDLTVVAEGVETKAQYDYLNAIGCDEAQGYFLSHPLPAEELIKHVLMYNSRSAEIS